MDKPLIIQSDGSIMLDVHHPAFEEARGILVAFAELVTSPEHMHTYRLSPLSLWNAAASGLGAEKICDELTRMSRYGIPESVLVFVRETIAKYGKVIMRSLDEEHLELIVNDIRSHAEISAHKALRSLLRPSESGFRLRILNRGLVKQHLMKIGYPVHDEAPLKTGDPLEVNIRTETREGRELKVRDYQNDSLNAFLGNRGPGTSYGVIVLPCGAGKTMVGMLTMAALKTWTLILTTNVAAVHQWKQELLDKTDLEEDQIGEYTGSVKKVCPVTVATYQVLVWRPDINGDFPHFDLLTKHPWGLIIYDEVHLLPAPVFRVTAEIQALRRLGLTATLVREDGHQDDVFALVGPKRYDVPWKVLEASGWIAEAICKELRVGLPKQLEIPYAIGTNREKYRIAAENPAKLDLIPQLVQNHSQESILIIGQYIDQLETISKRLDLPLITGKTSNLQRDKLYAECRAGRIPVMVVSKVANFAIDLPDASVAIQISGSFGSRQEEAQRLGRILRPKAHQLRSTFYSIVSRHTVEEEFSTNRQKFLTEQGYRYQIDIYDEEIT